MKRDYVISEKDSNLVFGVIKGVDSEKIISKNKSLAQKVGQAIQDQYCYDTLPNIIDESIKVTDDGVINIEFYCTDDDDNIELREVELNLTAIY